jgi:WD40 repeat protein
MFVLDRLPGKDDTITALAYSPDGQWLAATSGGYGESEFSTNIRGQVRVWDVPTRRQRAVLRETRNFARAVCFSPDGRLLTAGLGDRTVRLWAVDGLQERAVLRGHSRSVGAIAFSPDGRHFVTGCGDRTGTGRVGEVLRWTVRTADLSGLCPQPRGVWALVYAPGARAVIVGTATVNLWRLQPSHVKELLAPKTITRALALSPDGRTLALTAGWSVKLYDWPNCSERLALAGHKQIVTSLAFSPDGRTLASGSADGTVRFWDVGSGRERACFAWGMSCVACVAFAPDGLTAAAGGKTPNNLVIWDVDESGM